MATAKKAAKKKAPAGKASPKEAAAKAAAKDPGGSSLGRLLDEMYEVEQLRAEQARKVDQLKDRYKALEDQVWARFGANDLEGARGSVAQASVTRTDVGNVEDRAALTKHIKKTGELDLLQFRLSSTAVRERWARGDRIPGVTKFTKIGLALRKIRRAA